jgi:hypothetical protein
MEFNLKCPCGAEATFIKVDGKPWFVCNPSNFYQIHKKCSPELIKTLDVDDRIQALEQLLKLDGEK